MTGHDEYNRARSPVHKKYRELPIEGQAGIQAVIKAYQPYIKPRLIARNENVLKVDFHHRKGV